MLSRRRVARVGMVGALLAVLAACTVPGPVVPGPGGHHPNVVVIMTDDQTLSEMSVMPSTRQLLGEGSGTTFQNAFAPYSLCCPARATMLTGQYAHNHHVIDNVAPRGAENLDPTTTLPTWLQAAGYQTGFVGKYVNGYGKRIPGTVPPGWDDWYAMPDPEMLNYFGTTIIDDGVRVPTDPDSYQTDVLADHAVEDVGRFAADGRPFFLSVWVTAPHSGVGPGAPNPSSPAPAPRHAGLFPDLTAPRGPAYMEEDISDKPPIMSDFRAWFLAYLASQGVDAAGLDAMIDDTWRARAQSLVAVDELVVQVVDALDAAGVLDDTVIVFTSDNGWLIGEHGLFSKVLAYEESIRVPLLVRGPGFPAGAAPTQLVGHHDVAVTIAAIAGATPTITTDGRDLREMAVSPTAQRDRAILLQAQQPHARFFGVRAPGWSYIEWADGSVELYDLESDPYELTNIAGQPAAARAQTRLAAALDQLESCAGASCQVEIPADELR